MSLSETGVTRLTKNGINNQPINRPYLTKKGVDWQKNNPVPPIVINAVEERQKAKSRYRSDLPDNKKKNLKSRAHQSSLVCMRPFRRATRQPKESAQPKPIKIPTNAALNTISPASSKPKRKGSDWASAKTGIEFVKSLTAMPIMVRAAPPPAAIQKCHHPHRLINVPTKTIATVMIGPIERSLALFYLFCHISPRSANSERGIGTPSLEARARAGHWPSRAFLWSGVLRAPSGAPFASSGSSNRGASGHQGGAQSAPPFRDWNPGPVAWNGEATYA